MGEHLVDEHVGQRQPVRFAGRGDREEHALRCAIGQAAFRNVGGLLAEGEAVDGWGGSWWKQADRLALGVEGEIDVVGPLGRVAIGDEFQVSVG